VHDRLKTGQAFGLTFYDLAHRPNRKVYKKCMVSYVVDPRSRHDCAPARDDRSSNVIFGARSRFRIRSVDKFNFQSNWLIFWNTIYFIGQFSSI